MLTWLTSRVGRILAGLGVVLAAIVGALAVGRRDGAQNATSEVKENDNDRANEIRNRVDRGLDDRVRDYDDSGYRD